MLRYALEQRYDIGIAERIIGIRREIGFWSSASPKGKSKPTNKTFKDDWIFAITVRNGKVANIREYIDTQALARASEMDTSLSTNPSKPIPHETIRKVS